LQSNSHLPPLRPARKQGYSQAQAYKANLVKFVADQQQKPIALASTQIYFTMFGLVFTRLLTAVSRRLSKLS